MSYSTPILRAVTAFDASAAYRYPITYNGTQYTHINCVISTNEATPVEVVSAKQETYAAYYSIAADTLTNGVEYKIKVRVGDGENWSAWSAEVVFSCFSVGVAAITNVESGGTVAAQNYLFLGTFTQAETDTLNSYRFILYNAQGVAIDTQPETFSQDISYEVRGLSNLTAYYIELRCKSVAGIECTTGRIPFTAAYIQPVMSSVVDFTKQPQYGRMLMRMNLVQRSGEGEGYTFEDNEWVDVSADGAYVSFIEGVGTTQSDFSLYVWLKGVVTDEILVTLYGMFGVVDLYYNGECFVAEKSVSGITALYQGAPIGVESTDAVCVLMRFINNAIGVYSGVVAP